MLEMQPLPCHRTRHTGDLRQFFSQAYQFFDHIVDGFVARQDPQRLAKQDVAGKLALAPAGGGQHTPMQVLALCGT